MIEASLRRLSVFKSVVETSNFSLAAGALGIAPASVSAHIKALEQSVGKPLFLRGPGRPAKLTEAGYTLYEYTKDTLRRVSETVDALNSLDDARPRKIVVAFQHTVLAEQAAERLASFTKKHADLKVSSRRVTGDEVIRLLRAGEADIGFIFSVGGIEGLQSEVIGGSGDHHFVVAPSHPLAARSTIVASDLVDQDFVTPLTESYYFRLFDLAMKRIGVHRYGIAIEAEDGATIRELVRCSAGVGLVRESAAREDIKAGLLVRLPFLSPIPELEIRWAAAAGTPLSTEGRAFLDHMRAPLIDAAQGAPVRAAS